MREHKFSIIQSLTRVVLNFQKSIKENEKTDKWFGEIEWLSSKMARFNSDHFKILCENNKKELPKPASNISNILRSAAAAGKIEAGDWTIVEEDSEEEFVGYDTLQTPVRITRYRKINTKKEGDQYQGRDKKDYFDFKITNCRGKYDKADPGPQREKFMEDTIFILNQKTKKYYNKKTGKPYDKDSYNVKFGDIFPKKIEPTNYFKDHPKKQLAEEKTYRPDLHKENDPLIREETYRPDLYNEKDPLMQGADNLYYINNYRPGKIKPIKPEKIKDLEPFLELMELLATIEKERNH